MFWEKKELEIRSWCGGRWRNPIRGRNRSALSIKFHVGIAFLFSLALLGAAPSASAAAVTQDIHLQCECEARSRLLAFTATDIKTEERRKAERRLRMEIRNG